MKKSLAVIATAIISFTTLESCDFLDVVPNNAATIEDIYKTENKAQTMVLSCYGQIPDYFHPQNFPDMTASNEIITGWYGATRYFHFKSLVYGEETPTTTYYGLWSTTADSYPTGAVKKDIWEGIRYCYNVLNNIDKVPNISQENLNNWKGEALFLIAYYHQIMLEYYGPVVLVKEEMPANTSAAEMNVARSTYDECVDFISEKYDEAAALLPATQTTSNMNRATSVAALALKARLLLYAASPLVNGDTEFADFKNADGTQLINQTYDRSKWAKAMDAAKAAIDLAEGNGYQLYGGKAASTEQGMQNYHDAFTGPSGAYNLDNMKETLFGYGNQSTVSYMIKNLAPRLTQNHKPGYSGSGFRGYMIPTWDCVSRYLTKNGLPWDDDPETKGQDPYQIVDYNGEQTALWHTNREPRFYASIGFDRGTYQVSGGTITLKCRRGEEQQNDGNVKNEYQSDNGYYCQKWVSTKDAFDWSTKKFTSSTYLLPIIRLAELYLDYAEADFEYNGSLSSQSLAYLNKIRERCGLPDFQASWAKAGGVPSGDKLRNVLHDERTIELAMEGRRYHDIRRWKTAPEVMTEELYAWNLAGKTAEDFYQVTKMKESGVRVWKSYWLAIPLDQIQINDKLVQNPGY